MPDSTIIAAIIGAIATIAGAVVTYLIADRRFNAEHSFNHQIKVVLKEMLDSDKYDARSLEHIRSVLHGMKDEELRKLLIEVGAICIGEKEGKEMWARRNNRYPSLADDHMHSA